MPRKFVLEIDFDISKQTQQELAKLLHTIARDFDIGIRYSLKNESTNPVDVCDCDNKVVGNWYLK